MSLYIQNKKQAAPYIGGKRHNAYINGKKVFTPSVRFEALIPNNQTTSYLAPDCCFTECGPVSGATFRIYDANKVLVRTEYDVWLEVGEWLIVSGVPVGFFSTVSCGQDCDTNACR